jgi:blue copper oxidase
MKNKFLFLITSVYLSSNLSSQTYNNLWIPDTLSGVNFSLTIKDTIKQLRPGNQTITGSVNNNFWGPTLFFNKGDVVHLNVKNKLNDSTTIHWHGMHLPAVMDGGPHQVIPPGTLWQPYWKVSNNAGTYWYHPHLHEMTLEHLTKGIGGFIIVRDPIESSLALPRKYGIDDIPLVLTSRRYDANNQFVTTNTAYGDYMLSNGTPSAQINLPKQYVRLRILNAEIERGYDLGFSDNRTFYIIANDGGLLNSPIAVTRVKLMVGERVEIMVNLGSDQIGSSLNLMAYNSGQTFGFPGSEPGTNGAFGSLLNNINFNVLHINVIASTNNPIISVPASLTSNSYYTSANATVTRTINITNGNPGPNPIPFNFDNTTFSIGTINKTVNLNDIEKWTIINNNVFGHTFHLHDVDFKIVDRNGNPTGVGSHESGWKDVIYVPRNESVSFVAKFDDYADAIHPFMYHCHFSNHEDEGMMGQFIVTNTITAVNEYIKNENEFMLYPNPAKNILNVSFDKSYMQAYYIRIINSSGKTLMMLPKPNLENGIDINGLKSGTYFLQLTDDKNKLTNTKKFIKD